MHARGHPHDVKNLRDGHDQAEGGSTVASRVEVATPSAARALLRAAAQTHLDQDLLDTALLLISEIVGNALRHGRPPVLVFVACMDAHRLRVEVDDEDPRQPVVGQPDLLDEGGRGMWLVEAMSTAWGVDNHPLGGKTVWFEFGV